MTLEELEALIPDWPVSESWPARAPDKKIPCWYKGEEARIEIRPPFLQSKNKTEPVSIWIYIKNTVPILKGGALGETCWCLADAPSGKLAIRTNPDTLKAIAIRGTDLDWDDDPFDMGQTASRP